MQKINREAWYTPWEIITGKMLDEVTKARSLDTRHQMLLRFIRNKRIPAKNVGTESRPRYLVQGRDLIKFINRKKNG